MSVASNGAQANNSSYGPFISADGRYVAFDSGASNLVSRDTNNQKGVFMHELGSPPITDETAPSVSSVSPSQAQTGVLRNTSPTATFSEEMNPNTLTTSTVKLSVYNKKKGKYVPVTDTAVSCDSPCKTVKLDPYGKSSTLLGANKKYKVTITTGVKDKANNALAQNKVWTFTTGSS